MANKDTLAWHGAVKPRRPTEGFATTIGVETNPTAHGPVAPKAEERGPSLLEAEGGLQVEVKRLGESDGPEVIRPSGRVRMKST